MMNWKQHWKRWLTNTLWILFGIAMVVLFGAAIHKKNIKRCSDIRIEITGVEKHMFIDEQDVKELVNTNGNVIGTPIEALNLRRMEAALESNAWVRNAELFFDNNQVLQINIEERQPIARLFELNGKSYYLDTAMVQLPLSNKLTARVPVFTGLSNQSPKFDTSVLSQIVKMAGYILTDSFLTAQITQIDITPEKKFEFIPLIGEHTVLFGDTTDMIDRFKKLKSFYTSAWLDAGMDTYERLDVQYKNQIVAVRKGTAKAVADSAAARALIASTVSTLPQVVDTIPKAVLKPKSLPVSNNKKTVKPLTKGVKPKTLKKHTL